jgi:hypothetical protein
MESNRFKKYYTRHIKITKNLNHKNLLFCYTGDEYEKMSEIRTYCGYNKHECLNIFEQSLYKYTEKYFETNNIIYEDRDLQGCVSCDHNLKKEPNFLSFRGRSFNVIVNDIIDKNDIIIGEELVIGLYYYDKNTKKYIFVQNSEFDKVKQMFIIVNII